MNELALTDGESTGDTYYMMYYYNLDEKPVPDDFLHHRALARVVLYLHALKVNKWSEGTIYLRQGTICLKLHHTPPNKS